MKNATLLLLSLIFLIPLSSCTGKEEKSSLTWLTNYEEAVKQSKQTSKPIILFFTGSDWCSWCNKLELEVLDSKEFIRESGDRYIFVKVDFPLNTAQPAPLALQNKKLKEKHEIHGFPTLIILDEQERSLGETGYRAGGGRQYAQHLEKMINDNIAYREKMKTVESSNKASFEEIKNLYQKADDLNHEEEMQSLINQGIAIDKGNFFLLEKYRALIQEGLIHDEGTVAIRAKLLGDDPHNKNLTHYNVAVIDFQGYSKEMEANNSSADLAVAPLLQYIDKFGKDSSSSPEQLWRLHMLISQVYRNKQNIGGALKHAQLAYSLAPLQHKNSIKQAVDNMQSASAIH